METLQSNPAALIARIRAYQAEFANMSRWTRETDALFRQIIADGASLAFPNEARAAPELARAIADFTKDMPALADSLSSLAQTFGQLHVAFHNLNAQRN